MIEVITKTTCYYCEEINQRSGSQEHPPDKWYRMSLEQWLLLEDSKKWTSDWTRNTINLILCPACANKVIGLVGKLDNIRR